MERDGPGPLVDLAIAFLTVACIVVLGTAITEWLDVSGAAEWVVGVGLVIAVVGVLLVGYWFAFLSDAELAT